MNIYRHTPIYMFTKKMYKVLKVLCYQQAINIAFIIIYINGEDKLDIFPTYLNYLLIRYFNVGQCFCICLHILNFVQSKKETLTHIHTDCKY